MALTPNQQIIFAAEQAWGLLSLQNPTLADQIKTKFRADGYKYNAGLQALISQAPAEFQHPLYAYYSNPAAVKESISDTFQKTFKGVADNLATAAGAAGKGAVALGKGVGTQTNVIPSITNPIAALFQGAIWLRVAEVALGVILLAVGIAKLTNAVPIATKIAKVM